MKTEVSTEQKIIDYLKDNISRRENALHNDNKLLDMSISRARNMGVTKTSVKIDKSILTQLKNQLEGVEHIINTASEAQ